MRPSSPWRTLSKAGTLRASTKTRTIRGAPSPTIPSSSGTAAASGTTASGPGPGKRDQVRRRAAGWSAGRGCGFYLPLCSAGIVSFSPRRRHSTRRSSRSRRRPFSSLSWAARRRRARGPLVGRHQRSRQDARQDFLCKIGWLASIATPFGNLAVQICKVAFHPQLKRAGFLEASGTAPGGSARTRLYRAAGRP